MLPDQGRAVLELRKASLPVRESYAERRAVGSCSDHIMWLYTRDGYEGATDYMEKGLGCIVLETHRRGE